MNRGSDRTADLIGAAVLLAVGGSVALMATDYSLVGQDGQIQPGFMPFVAGALMALFGLGVGFEALRPPSRPSQAEEPESAEEVPAAGTEGRRKLLVFPLMLAAILATPYLGFLPAFGLLVFVLLFWVEREPIGLSLLIAVAAIVVTWLVFVQFLDIPLPTPGHYF